MVPIKTHEPSRGFLSKSAFGYKNKAHDFEDATFEWLLKRGLPPETSEERHRKTVLCEIEVHAWDKHDQGANPALTQVFSPDKIGSKGALDYARKLISEGHALLTTVRWSVRFPWDGKQQLVEEQMFSIRDPRDRE